VEARQLHSQEDPLLEPGVGLEVHQRFRPRVPDQEFVDGAVLIDRLSLSESLAWMRPLKA
jgi:hypothetical protein